MMELAAFVLWYISLIMLYFQQMIQKYFSFFIVNFFLILDVVAAKCDRKTKGIRKARAHVECNNFLFNLLFKEMRIFQPEKVSEREWIITLLVFKNF